MAVSRKGTSDDLRCAGVEHVHVVSEDGSPHGPKHFVLWNPPFAAPDRRGSGGKGLNMSHTEGRKRGGAKRWLTRPHPASIAMHVCSQTKSKQDKVKMLRVSCTRCVVLHEWQPGALQVWQSHEPSNNMPRRSASQKEDPRGQPAEHLPWTPQEAGGVDALQAAGGGAGEAVGHAPGSDRHGG